jgi:hypothetical protein
MFTGVSKEPVASCFRVDVSEFEVWFNDAERVTSGDGEQARSRNLHFTRRPF